MVEAVIKGNEVVANLSPALMSWHGDPDRSFIIDFFSNILGISDISPEKIELSLNVAECLADEIWIGFNVIYPQDAYRENESCEGERLLDLCLSDLAPLARDAESESWLGIFIGLLVESVSRFNSKSKSGTIVGVDLVSAPKDNKVYTLALFGLPGLRPMSDTNQESSPYKWRVGVPFMGIGHREKFFATLDGKRELGVEGELILLVAPEEIRQIFGGTVNGARSIRFPWNRNNDRVSKLILRIGVNLYEIEIK